MSEIEQITFILTTIVIIILLTFIFSKYNFIKNQKIETNDIYNNENRNNNLYLCLVKIVVTIVFIIFALSKYDKENYYNLKAAILLYYVIVIITKFIICNPYIKINTTNNKIIDNIDVFDIIVSPDYVITYFFKNELIRCGKSKRAELIKKFNCENLLITFIFILSCCVLNVSNNKIDLFYNVLLYRIISRMYEIIASFVLDVIKNNDKKTNLSFNDRIGLSFLSILEVIGLQIAKQIYLNSDNNISKCILNSIYNVFSLNFETLSLTDFMCYISVFALYGVVITSYISDGKSNKKE